MGLLAASNRHFTVSPHEVFTWFWSAGGSHFMACLPTGEKLSLIGVVRCFWRVLENYDCRIKFNSSLGMEYNGGLYGFSAVKVKLVDSLIWSPFIPGWIRPRTPMTRRFDTCASFLFWTICSLNFRTLIDALSRCKPKVRNSTCPLARDKWIFRRTTKMANIVVRRTTWIAAGSVTRQRSSYFGVRF